LQEQYMTCKSNTPYNTVWHAVATTVPFYDISTLCNRNKK